jgi:hypothetical protein
MGGWRAVAMPVGAVDGWLVGRSGKEVLAGRDERQRLQSKLFGAVAEMPIPADIASIHLQVKVHLHPQPECRSIGILFTGELDFG